VDGELARVLLSRLSTITPSIPVTMAPRSIPTDTAAILPPLLSLVQSNAYSAHQKTRTTSARLISHGYPDEAITVLFEVAKALLKSGETGSGVDLATAMLAAYDGKAEKVTDESRGQSSSACLADREETVELTIWPLPRLLRHAHAVSLRSHPCSRPLYQPDRYLSRGGQLAKDDH
jgi:hypothetical protein